MPAQGENGETLHGDSSCWPESWVDREGRAEAADLLARRGDRRLFVRLADGVQHIADQFGDPGEFGGAEAARRAGRRAKPDAGGHRRLFRVERDAVLVTGNRRAVQSLLRGLAGKPLGPASCRTSWVSRTVARRLTCRLCAVVSSMH